MAAVKSRTLKLGEAMKDVARLRYYHVIPSSGRWSVVRSPRQATIRVFSTPGAAVKFAKGLTKSWGGEVVVHGSDGRITKTYGSRATLMKHNG